MGEKLRDWLNFEWDRLQKGSKSLFSTRSLRLFTPEGEAGSQVACRILLAHKPLNTDTFDTLLDPRQNNGYDCVVFVCRYAFAMYMMRGIRFSQKEALPFGQARFGALITNNRLFAFSSVDIQRIRLELKVLITNLSVLYKQAKSREDEAKRLTREKHKEMELDRKVAAAAPILKPCPIATDGSTTKLVVFGTLVSC